MATPDRRARPDLPTQRPGRLDSHNDRIRQWSGRLEVFRPPFLGADDLADHSRIRFKGAMTGPRRTSCEVSVRPNEVLCARLLRSCGCWWWPLSSPNQERSDSSGLNRSSQLAAPDDRGGAGRTADWRSRPTVRGVQSAHPGSRGRSARPSVDGVDVDVASGETVAAMQPALGRASRGEGLLWARRSAAGSHGL